MAATVRAEQGPALGRLLIAPPAGMSPELARLIDALAREAAARDHAADNAGKALAGAPDHAEAKPDAA